VGPGAGALIGSTAFYDSRQLTANAQAAFQDGFARQVDPDRALPEAERYRRGEPTPKAYDTALAAEPPEARNSRHAASGQRS
jgi:hypothetical protein